MKTVMPQLTLQDRHQQILGLIRESWVRFLLAVVCMLVEAGATSTIPLLVKPVIDGIFIDKNVFLLKLLPIAVVMVFFLKGFAAQGQDYLMNHVGQNVIRQLRNRLYDHIQDLPLSFFYEEKTGVLMSRITNDVNIVKTMVSTAVTRVFRDSFTVIGMTCVIFYQDWKLAIFAFLILPMAFYPIVAIGRRVRRTSTGCQRSMADLSAFLHETLAGNKIVKAFGMETHEKTRFHQKTDHLFRLEMRQVLADSMSNPIMEVLAGLGLAFVIWFGGFQVVEGTKTAGTFFSFMTAVFMLYDPVKKLSKLNNAVQQGMAATDRIFDVLEHESDIREAEDPVILSPGRHRVQFQSVSFSYGGAPTLRHIDLDVSPGEVVALVGMSGGGKTTLVNLIPRFYDVTAGAIRIDGVDIREVSLASLRRQIAIVTQEPILFNDTIGRNIAYGMPDAPMDRIEAAARAAYAYDFIQTLPEGFDTNIGELGSRLSGGEKQRICIARALLKDAPILILDEATSSLDTESEKLVQKALENLMQGRTTFMIAHRLSTISHADRIVVIVDGRIVEEGSHQELIARGGEYHKLYEMQYN